MSRDRCELLCLDLPKAEELRRRRVSPRRASELAGGPRALADPTRLTLATTLAEAGETCVCDLSWIVERAENLVSHHLRVLRAAGLVRSRREAKQVFYSLTAAGEELLSAVLAHEPSSVEPPIA